MDPGLLDGLEHRGHELRGNVQFPAEFTDKGDAERPHRRAGDHNVPQSAEGKRLVADIVLADVGEDYPRFRAHQAEHAVG